MVKGADLQGMVQPFPARGSQPLLEGEVRLKKTVIFMLSNDNPKVLCRALSHDRSMQDTEFSKTVLWVDCALGTLEDQITKNTLFRSDSW
jgi:hypothetical protein